MHVRIPTSVVIEETHTDIAITEMRLHYERLTALYDGIKVRILALIAGEVAIIPFVFSDGFPDVKSAQEGIFFAGGMVLFVVSFSLLLWAISTADWQMPFGTVDSRSSERLYPTSAKLKRFLKEDYESCSESCLKKIKVRARIFNVTLWLLVASLLILFVLKYT